MDLKNKLRHVMDYPKPGIDFIDITTVLQDKEAFNDCIEKMKELVLRMGNFDVIIGSESRGFIFGAPLAYVLKKGFIPIRKKGKLPYNTVRVEYELEYGTDVLEMHEDAISLSQRAIIIDDLLATGGTTEANIKLIERLGGIVVGAIYFVELSFLNARCNKLKNYKIDSVVQF